MSNNANLQLIQYKVIHRIHLTGDRIFKFHSDSLTNTNTCTNCTQSTPDTYIHALWFCSPVHLFWKQVTESLSALLNCCIPLSPSLCLLGDTSNITLHPTYIKLLLVALTIAKKTILVNWKSKTKINIQQWKNLLIDHISMEHLSTSIKFCTIDNEQWTPLINFLIGQH